MGTGQPRDVVLERPGSATRAQKRCVSGCGGADLCAQPRLISATVSGVGCGPVGSPARPGRAAIADPSVALLATWVLSQTCAEHSSYEKETIDCLSLVSPWGPKVSNQCL